MYTSVNPSLLYKSGVLGCQNYTYTVDSRYLELQGTHWNTSRYPYFDISELREWGEQ